MNNKKIFTIGVVVPNFCDQEYLRDRDERIEATTVEEAIKIYIKEYGYWLHEDEKKFIKEVK